MPRLAQTLHGYDQGHRLLAATEDMLDARELALLDRLSDLSGYLPSGATFDHYHTGFPCGRYYALSSTWLDTSATRAGTVLTHTLLLPLQEARALEDLWALAAHHRRPQGRADRDFYTRPLDVELVPSAPEAEVSPAEQEGVTALAFGQSQRPLLWVDARRPEGVVRHLWRMEWPEQRERFAFCTLALQLRAVEGRVFDFLGLPPEARGAFLQFAGSEAWWDNGRLMHPRVQGLTQQPWVQELSRGGPAGTHRLIEWCRAQALRLPQPWELPVLWRFLDLERAASERLAAARSRADLFERLWPQIDPQHPCAVRVLEDLMARQRDAALKPKPFWELVDLLKRPLLQRRCEADPAFAVRVEELRAGELTERLRQEPVLSAAELPELVGVPGAVGWGPRSVRAIQQAVKNAPEPAVLALHLLRISSARAWTDIAEAVLAALSEAERLRLLEEASQDAPGLQPLLAVVWGVVEKLRDPLFALEAALRRAEPVEGLKTAMRLLLAREPVLRREQVDALLHRVDTSAHLAWALDEADARLAPLAAEIIGQELLNARLPPAEVQKLCEGRANGPRVLAAWFMQLGRSRDTAWLLRESPALAKELVLWMLRDERLPQDKALIRQGVEALEPEQLLSVEVLEALRETRERSKAREVLYQLGPVWIRAVVDSVQPEERLVPWLDLPLLREWIQGVRPGQISLSLGPGAQGRILPRLAAVFRAWLQRAEVPDLSWSAHLLAALVGGAPSEALEEATMDLVPILRHVLPRYEGQSLAMQVLGSVSEAPTPQGWRLVELTFPAIYPRLVEGAPSRLEQWVRSMSAWITGDEDKDKGWNYAKPVRQWLIDTYVACGWPAESLLRCLNGDERLFRRLAHRAARSARGLEFLRQLPRRLDSEPELARRWRFSVEEVLTDPYRTVDYE